MSVAIPVTAEQLLAMPRNGLRRELVQGEIIEMNPAGFSHGEISDAVGLAAGKPLYPHKLGAVVGAETGFVLARNPDTVRAPDVAFVLQSRVEPPPRLKSSFPARPIWLSRCFRPTTARATSKHGRGASGRR